jgi:hypothetical protein
MVDMEKTEKRKYVRKKSNFKLSSDWIIKEPVDYEHKYYILMDFIKYCDDKIDKFELYPLFSEISFHLANLQSISNDFKYIDLDKKFKSVDDEILISELKFLPIPKLNDDDLIEFNKILKRAGLKVYEYFNIVKALWTITYDSVAINLINKDDIKDFNSGYFYCEIDNIKYVWSFSCGEPGKLKVESKIETMLSYNQETKKRFKTILKDINYNPELPIFEIKVSNNLPLEHTLLPIFKRKVVTYIMQSNTIVSLKNS